MQLLYVQQQQQQQALLQQQQQQLVNSHPDTKPQLMTINAGTDQQQLLQNQGVVTTTHNLNSFALQNGNGETHTSVSQDSIQQNSLVNTGILNSL